MAELLRELLHMEVEPPVQDPRYAAVKGNVFFPETMVLVWHECEVCVYCRIEVFN